MRPLSMAVSTQQVSDLCVKGRERCVKYNIHIVLAVSFDMKLCMCEHVSAIVMCFVIFTKTFLHMY